MKMKLKKSSSKKEDQPKKKSLSTTTSASDRVRPIKSRKSKTKIVVYGRSGTGKTTFAGTFPGKILVLDVKDEGLDSISDIIGADYTDIRNWDDFEDMYWYILDHPEFKTIIIDTVSQLQELAMAAAVKKKASRSAVVRPKGDWGTMSRREWGDVAAIMKTWLINYRDLDRNVVFIAQDRTFNVDDEGESVDNVLTPEVGPRLMPSVASVLNASVSIIGNTYIRQRIKKVRDKKTGRVEKEKVAEYCLRIGPSPVYTTKVRKPKHIQVPQAIVDPTYEALMDFIKGETTNG